MSKDLKFYIIFKSENLKLLVSFENILQETLSKQIKQGKINFFVNKFYTSSNHLLLIS